MEGFPKGESKALERKQVLGLASSLLQLHDEPRIVPLILLVLAGNAKPRGTARPCLHHGGTHKFCGMICSQTSPNDP